MSYPTSVWDGSSEVRDAGQFKAPQAQDWNKVVQEVIATQTELDAVKAGSRDITGDLTVTKAGMVQVGGFAASAGTDAALNFAEALDVNEDNYLATVQAYGASAADLTNAYNCTVGRFRHVVNVGTGNLAHETYGVTGQVVVKDTTLVHLHSGVLGTFEGHTSGVVLSNASGYVFAHAGIMSRVGGHASIDATLAPLCGFLAFNNASAALAGGIQVALAATAASGSYPWDALLASDKCSVVLYTPTATNYEGGVKAVAGTAPSGTVTHFIKIRVGAATYAYVPAYTADTVS